MWFHNYYNIFDKCKMIGIKITVLSDKTFESLLDITTDAFKSP